MTEINGHKVAYHALKNSVGPDNDFGPQHSYPIFSILFVANHKVSVPIGKVMMRGFQNNPIQANQT